MSSCAPIPKISLADSVAFNASDKIEWQKALLIASQEALRILYEELSKKLREYALREIYKQKGLILRELDRTVDGATQITQEIKSFVKSLENILQEIRDWLRPICRFAKSLSNLMNIFKYLPIPQSLPLLTGLPISITLNFGSKHRTFNNILNAVLDAIRFIYKKLEGVSKLLKKVIRLIDKILAILRLLTVQRAIIALTDLATYDKIFNSKNIPSFTGSDSTVSYSTNALWGVVGVKVDMRELVRYSYNVYKVKDHIDYKNLPYRENYFENLLKSSWKSSQLGTVHEWGKNIF